MVRRRLAKTTRTATRLRVVLTRGRMVIADAASRVSVLALVGLLAFGTAAAEAPWVHSGLLLPPLYRNLPSPRWNGLDHPGLDDGRLAHPVSCGEGND